SHPQFTQAFSAQASMLTGVIDEAKRVLTKGESASAKDISDAYEDLAPAQRAATKSLAEYDSYQTKRKTVEKAIAALKKHAQATAMQAEITRIERGLSEADTLGAHRDGGWHR